MAETHDKKLLKVRLELEPSTGDWVASLEPPLKRVQQAIGLESVIGDSPGQARNRLVSLVEESFPAIYAFEDELRPPAELQARVDEYRANEQERARLAEWTKENRLPLARELIRHRVEQKLAADLLLVTPTWLGQELQKHATSVGTGKTAVPRTTGKTTKLGLPAKR